MSKPLPSEGSGWLRGTQLVLMTAAGRLLEADAHDPKNGKVDMVRGLQQVLQKYAALPASERRPSEVTGEVKPVPAPPPGGLVLTIYDRPLGRPAEGEFRLPQGSDLGSLRSHAPSGQRSSLWLTAEERRSLLPPDPRKGQTCQVPAKLTKRILLYGLWPQTLWVVEHSWQPDSLRQGELQLTVEEVSPEAVRMRVHGSVVLSAKARLKLYPTGKTVKDVENRYEARLEGVLVYDTAREQVSQWDMVALGDYTGAMFTSREENGRHVGDDKWREATRENPVPFGFAFELDRTSHEAPAERRRPMSFVHSYIFREREPFYWDPDKWDEDWKKRNRP